MDSSLRVGLFVERADTYGGGEVLARRVTEGLSHRGYRVVRYADEAGRGTSDVNREMTSDHGELRLIRFNAVNRLLSRTYISQPLPALAQLEENDVNLILVYRLPTARYLREAAGTSSANIFMLHGLAFEPKAPTPLSVNLYQTFLRRRLRCLHADINKSGAFLQVPTHTAARAIKSAGVDQGRIRVIWNGIPFEKYLVGRNDDSFNILFIGRIEDPQKGIARLVNVARGLERLPDSGIRLVIIGEGRSSGRLSARLSHVSRTSYRGYVSEEEKLELLRTSNALLCTSNMEPFSLAVLEGLASGLPIVTTPCSGPSEIVSEADIFGSIGTYMAPDLLNRVRALYLEWREDKTAFFKKKVRRRHEAEIRFSQDLMLRAYAQFMEATVTERRMPRVSEF